MSDDPTPAEAAAMAQSKGKKKQGKGKPMHLDEFHSATGSSWADEVGNALPTGPSTSSAPPARDEPATSAATYRGYERDGPRHQDERGGSRNYDDRRYDGGGGRGGYNRQEGGYNRQEGGRGGYNNRRDEGQDDRRRQEREEPPSRFDTSGNNWRDEKREPRQDGGVFGRARDGGERRPYEDRGDREPIVRDTYEHRGYQIDRNAKPPRTDFPTQAPYKAFLGNIPFRITDNDVRDLFSGLNVLSIHFPRDPQNDRLKGFGYVEFETIDELKTALEMNGAVVLERSVHVDLATPSERPERPSQGDWRSSPRSTGDRPSGDRQERGPRDPEQSRDRPSRSDNIDDWRVHSEPRSQPRPTGGDNQSPRQPRQQGSRDDFRNGPREPREPREPRDSRPPMSEEGSSERPKLNVKPRSEAPRSDDGGKPAASKSNPFGAAKARDENEMQKQAEERRKQREEDASKK